MADDIGRVVNSGNVTGVNPTTSDDLYTIVTENVTAVSGSPGSSQCYTIDYNYDIITAVICAMCFIFGIVYTFFGYRFFKAVMFLTGFLFGSVLVYLICTEEKILSTAANAGIAVGAGLLCGLLTMLVQYVGLFLTGFNLGISIATGVLVLLEQFVLHPHTKWIPIGVLVGTGVLFALFTLKFQKGGTILGTSVFGGLLMISCLDFFIENFLIMHYLWDRVKADVSPPVCWYSWIILGCWPFCCLVGIITQWKITGKGYSHKEVLHNRKAQNVNLKRTRSKEKDKTKDNTHQSRYRHLYQIRRFNGDVISQNYIQTIQNKLSPSLRNMTPVPQTDPQTEPESTNTTLTQVPEV